MFPNIFWIVELISPLCSSVHSSSIIVFSARHETWWMPIIVKNQANVIQIEKVNSIIDWMTKSHTISIPLSSFFSSLFTIVDVRTRKIAHWIGWWWLLQHTAYNEQHTIVYLGKTLSALLKWKQKLCFHCQL